jgi:hypothetical protein
MEQRLGIVDRRRQASPDLQLGSDPLIAGQDVNLAPRKDGV